ncbi:hypothetical protein HaLaN_17871, partial [Haematococcus lacustris]
MSFCRANRQGDDSQHIGDLSEVFHKCQRCGAQQACVWLLVLGATVLSAHVYRVLPSHVMSSTCGMKQQLCKSASVKNVAMALVTPAIACTPVAQEITFLLISARMRPPIGAMSC